MNGQTSTELPGRPSSDNDNISTRQKSRRISKYIFWTPPWCRWDAENPPPFTIWHNMLFAFVGGFTSANLFYSYPILNVLAADFKTTEGGVSTIPTLAQAGNATGLLLVLPLADFFPRRRFVICLVSASAIFWIGLCLTKGLTGFNVFTYLSAVFNGSSQIMLPLVAELSPPEKRAFNISVVAIGPTLGILLARILSGIVANYTSWRNVYWMALALQACVLVALVMFMPDYPATNPLTVRQIAKRYPKILWSIITLFPRYPVLVHTSLTTFCTFYALTSFWTTLTFLLAGPPYHYSTSVIGLFGLVGVGTIVLGPVYGKYIVQPLKEPVFSVIVGKTVSLVGIIIGTFSGKHTVVGPILQGFLLDAGLMIVQIANRIAIFPVEPKGRNRVNTAFVSVLYLGQLTGTKAGSEVYEKHGGWIASGSLSLAVIALSYAVIASRGPYEEGWFGWSGGWRLKRKGMEEDIENEDSKKESPVEMANLEGKDKEAHAESSGNLHRTVSAVEAEADQSQHVLQDDIRRRSKP